MRELMIKLPNSVSSRNKRALIEALQDVVKVAPFGGWSVNDNVKGDVDVSACADRVVSKCR
jgi:hypothetical protein